ncbi:MAG: HNH endonuclease, partial [Gammaproteobacteria bacterium]
RTPNALAMKLSNFASLDPSITVTGRHGLKGVSALDREIWNEFHSDWDGLAAECARLHKSLLSENYPYSGSEPEDELDDDLPLADFTGEMREAVVQKRIKQDFFRRAVLASYRGRCCISGVSENCLLVASHIIPWSKDKSNRLNPRNGLCLSAIHDKAFDKYLFSLSEDYRVVLSKQMKISKDAFLRTVFWTIEGKRIEMPERFAPAGEFVAKHRQTMLSQES